MNKKVHSAPLVSVVMPSLNQMYFIEAAISCVFEQNYANIELIVADGMSTDGTLEVLIKLQAKYGARLRWTSQRDGGAADALNHALAQANGEVVGWLNSDDLYVPGAISRAMAYFVKHPKHQMVYGQGQHIDAAGKLLGNYPSKPPSTSLEAFANGSFICQPTVFMRREALTQVGALDTSIRTAFDFDLFVRFFKRFPNQIGMIKSVQASSRLHSACMTQRLRRQVALDGMRVVAKEIGTVPVHWFWTHIDEMCASYPLGEDAQPLTKQLEVFLKEAKSFYKMEALKAIVEALKVDARFRLAKPNLFATVQPDGWVSKRVIVKYRWEGKPAAAVLVKCSAPWPVAGNLQLRIVTPTGEVQRSSIEVPDDFVLRFEIPETEQSGCMVWVVKSAQGFVPAQHDDKSKDRRKLAFQVLGIGLEA
jgi:glycosyltransferase involved in cell wall biosynthesis